MQNKWGQTPIPTRSTVHRHGDIPGTIEDFYHSTSCAMKLKA